MKKKIILASASPRRQELLTQIGLDFEVHPSDWEEKTEKELPGEVVQELSFHKAMDVYHRLQAGAGESLAEESLVVIGADTIVACQGQILGKPGDKERAAGMLRLLQGGVHQVYTGVSLAWQEQGKTESFSFYEKLPATWKPGSRWIRREPMGYRAVLRLLSGELTEIIIMWWAFRWAGFIRK